MQWCLEFIPLYGKSQSGGYARITVFSTLLICIAAGSHPLFAGSRSSEGGPERLPIPTHTSDGLSAPEMIAPTVCNDPLTGKNAVVDDLPGGTACVLCGDPNVGNLTDSTLSNFTSFNPTATVLGSSIVSIKDIAQDYDAGTRAGFVIEPQGGLLGTGVLGSFTIRTYLNNVLQETFIGSSQISLNVLGASGGKQRLTIVSTQMFDEIELVQTALINTLSSIRVYYAFVEPAGCDYDCMTEVITGAPYNATIQAGRTGLLSGVCVSITNPDCVTNEGRVVDADLTNFAVLNATLGVDALLALSVKANNNIPIPAGYDAGFVIRDNGLLGLLSLQVLGATSIRTYLGGIPQETKSFASLADLTVFGDDLQALSFKTTLPFDEIQLRLDGGLVSIGVDVRVYYALVRPDTDNDGFVDCVDKCAGQNDNLDNDGDGVPNGCDLVCSLNAGTDLTACPTTTTAQLPAAGTGQIWSGLSGNPSAASVNAAGAVTGMTAEGVYGFVLTQGACHDTVFINHQESNLDASCNNPIVGYGVVIDQVGLTGGICLLCGGGTTAVDGNLNDYATYTVGVGVLSATSVISIKDTTQVYPAGRRTGFLVEPVGGLLDASALSTLQIRTYLNNVPREIATTAGGLLGATALAGDGNKQRISFVTTQSFDEVELVVTSLLGALTTLRIYYAFEEPAAGCPDLSDTDICSEDLIAGNTTYCGQISYPRSGISGAVCAVCEVAQLGNLIDASPSNYAIIDMTGGVADATGSVSVKTRQVIPAGSIAGYTVSSTFNLADVNVLSGITLTTYLNGVQRDQLNGMNSLLFAKVLNPATGRGQISFKTTFSFDEIQLSIGGVATVLTETRVYGAFVYADSDNDGTPDCIDKCCGNPDYLDSNGDGQPDACDPLPIATDDNVTVDSNEPATIDVLANDNFGDDGPAIFPIAIMTPPLHGTATVDDNGTPDDPTDDTIIYTPANNYAGPDQFVYRICELTGDCDVATVFINVAPVNDPPVANPDPYTVNEDTPLSGNVVSNDTDPDGPAVVVSLLSPPSNGMLTLNSDGTFTYTPNSNFNGTDNFTYSYCDGATPNLCDQATVTINILTGSLSLSLKVQLQGALYGSLDGLMRDDLRSPVQYIPNQEPYSALAAFSHSNGGGGETVTAPATVFAGNGDNSIVDWVFVELRNSSSPTTVVATRSALLQRDGDVVDVDGVSPIFFANSAPSSYYVSVRHRNHLGTMTANAVPLAVSGNLVDFTSLSTPLWDDGTNLNGLEQTTVSGKYALWAANANVSTHVIFAGQGNDKDAVFNQIDQAPGNILRSQTYIRNGYHTGDHNLNARAIFAGQNNDVDFIFNNVDGHPKNILDSQTFIIREQLPHP